MPIINCFQGDKNSLNNLRELFVESIIKLAANGSDIDFMSVWGEVVKNRDMRIDRESASMLYDEVKNDSRITGLDGNIHAFMTTSDDLQRMNDGVVKRRLSKIGKKGEEKDGKITFEKSSPAKSLALAWLDVLNNKKYGRKNPDGKLKDEDYKKIRSSVYKYAKSLLGVKKATGKAVDILGDILETSIKSDDFAGTSDGLFAAMKDALDDFAGKITDPVVRLEFEHEISKLREAGFNFGITEGKRKKILYKALAESRFGKKTKGGKQIPDYALLAREEDMEAALREVLSNVLDEKGYKGDKTKVYAAIIGDIQEIKKLNAYEKAYKDDLFKNDLGREVAIYNGFYKPEGGRKVVDYKKVNPEGRKRLKGLLLQAGYDEGTAKRMSERGLDPSDKETLESAFQEIGKKYAEIRSIPMIKEVVRRLMVINNKPYRHRINEMDRLVTLQNKGIGMDATTDALAASLLGIRVKASAMEEMNKIVAQYAEVMQRPEELYKEIAAANPGMTWDYHGNIPFGLWASGTLEQLNKRMSNLIIDSITEGSNLLESLGFLDKLQKLYLPALLTNPVNIEQNFNTAINTLIVSGKKQLGEKKMKMFIGMVLLDAQGALQDPTVMQREFKDWAEAELFREKVGAFYRSATQGVLQGIDGVAYFHGTRRSFYASIREALVAKGISDKPVKNGVSDVDALLAPYFSGDTMAKAYMIAEHLFKKAGITPKTRGGVARYSRELEAEAMRIQMGLTMGGVLTEKRMVDGKMVSWFSPEELLARRESAAKLTRITLGKELPSVMTGTGKARRKVDKASIPLFSNYVAGLGRSQGANYNDAIRKFSEKPTFSNGLSLVGTWWLKMFLHGGPWKFGAGIAVWGDKAFGTIWTNSLVTIRERKKEYLRLISKSNPGEPANIDKIIETMEFYEIDRRKNYLFATAWISSWIMLTAVGLLVGDDDDDETNFYEEAINGVYDLGEKNPFFKLLFTRIAAIQIRIIYALKKAATQKDFVKSSNDIMNVLFNTGPMDMRMAFDQYRDRDGWKWGAIGKMLTPTVFPSPLAAIGNVVGSFVNVAGDINRGSRLKTDPNVSNVNAMYLNPPISNPFWNGVMIDAFGQQYNYYLQGHGGVDLGIMENDGPRNPKEYEPLRGKKFSDIDWADYGSPELNDGKFDVNIAYKNLDKLKAKMLEIGTDLNIPAFKESVLMDNLFRRPYSSMFQIPLEGMTPKELKEIKKYMKIDDNAQTFNIALLAAKKKGLKLTSKDIYNAIRYKNFQDSITE